MDKLHLLNPILGILSNVLLIVILIYIEFIRKNLELMSNYDLNLLCNSMKSEDYKIMSSKSNLN